jgi:hypothetical protein
LPGQRDAERLQRRGRGPLFRLCRRQYRLRLLHLAERHQTVGGERALAVDHLLRERDARLRRNERCARAAKFDATKLGQRLATLHGGVESGVKRDHLGRNRARELGVAIRVHLDLSQHRRAVRGSMSRHHDRGDLQVAHHLLRDAHLVGGGAFRRLVGMLVVVLCLFRRLSPTRTTACGGKQRRDHYQCPQLHRKPPVAAASSTPAIAASSR